MDKVTFTRQQIYDLIWSDSMLNLSKKYEISDVGLRKMCVRMNIPLPRAGHWAKLPADRSAPSKLSENYTGEKTVTLTLRSELKEGPNINPVKELRKEIEQDSKMSLIVPDRLTAPDKLVIAAKENLEEIGKSIQYPGAILSTRSRVLDIRVSTRNAPRALRFMDTLIKSLRTRGHEILFDDKKTYAVVNNQKIRMYFGERAQQATDDQGNTSSKANRLHFFKMEGFNNREWKDGKFTIEEQLSEILAKMEVDSQLLKAREDENRKWREDYDRQERQRKEKGEREDRELTAFKALLWDATRWQKADILRNYIATARQQAIALGKLTKELEDRLEWALAKADWYDPLLEKEDVLLKDVDKETLTFKRKSNFF